MKHTSIEGMKGQLFKYREGSVTYVVTSVGPSTAKRGKLVFYRESGVNTPIRGGRPSPMAIEDWKMRVESGSIVLLEARS